MVLKYVISPKADLLQDMIAKVYEASNDNPGAEVYQVVIPERDGAGVPTPGAGHQVPYTLIANGLDKVVHVVRLFTFDTNELLHYYNAEAKTDLVVIFDPIRFKIGDGGDNTPVVGAQDYQNDLLISLTGEEFDVFRNNYGYLFPGIHIDTTATVADGIWSLKLDGDEFGENEEFVIFRRSKVITTVVNDSVVGKWFGGFIDINADTVYDPIHLRKLLRFNGEVKFTFPVDGNIPIGYGFVFQNFGAGDIGDTAMVEFLNKPLLWNGSPKTELDIPLFSEACFSFDGDNWNVVYFVSTTFANDTDVPPGQTIAAGNLAIGDVPGGNAFYVVTHGKAVAGDYLVLLSIKSPDGGANMTNDNKLTYCWAHHATDKPNKFHVCMKEQSGQAQNVSITWLIIKL